MATKFNFIDDVNQSIVNVFKKKLYHVSTPHLFSKNLLIFYFYVNI